MANEVASDRNVATLSSGAKLDSLNFKNTILEMQLAMQWTMRLHPIATLQRCHRTPNENSLNFKNTILKMQWQCNGNEVVIRSQRCNVVIGRQTRIFEF